jgi:hypothetical protein
MLVEDTQADLTDARTVRALAEAYRALYSPEALNPRTYSLVAQIAEKIEGILERIGSNEKRLGC